jgi:hypothetical protein
MCIKQIVSSFLSTDQKPHESLRSTRSQAVQPPQPNRKPKDKLSPKINSENSLKEDVHINQTQLTEKNIGERRTRIPNQVEISSSFPLLFQHCRPVGFDLHGERRMRGLGMFIWML